MEMFTIVQADAEHERAWINGSYSDLDEILLIIKSYEKSVGFCIFRRSTAEVRRLFVLPEHRRSRIGSRAITQLLGLFRKDGHQFINLQFSEEYVAKFLAKSLITYSSFNIEEGMVLVSTRANYEQCFDESGMASTNNLAK